MSTVTEHHAGVLNAAGGSAPLRSYLFLLVPRTRSRGGGPVMHYVVEESPERAIEVCGQSHPGHRILSVRDVTDEATAA